MKNHLLTLILLLALTFGAAAQVPPVIRTTTGTNTAGYFSGNGGGLTNLQATNIVFQDYTWLSNTNNSDNGGTMTLNNGYQRHTFVGANGNTFIVTGLISPSLKPGWAALKILNDSGSPMELGVYITSPGPARPIGSGTPQNADTVAVPYGKVAWLTIHNDGMAQNWSITYAVAIEP